MRIAIVYGSSAPIPPVRGIAPGIVIYNTVEHLQLESDDELAVFSRWEPALDDLEFDRLKYRNVKVYKPILKFIRAFKKLPYRFYYPILFSWFGQTDDDWLGYVLSLVFEVRTFRPHVIVCHVNYKLPLLLRRFYPKAKILYYHHGSNMHLRLSRNEWQAFQWVLDGLVSVSQAAFDGLKSAYGGPIQIPHWIIHNGVDERLFHPDQKEKERAALRARFQAAPVNFIFLYAGRLSHTKGIHHLIQTFIKLAGKYPHARLWIAGSSASENRPDYGYEKKLHEMASALPKSITFIGWFPNEQMSDLMSAADVFVLAAVNDYEGVPLSLLESMACGTPVIASSIGGIPEIVVHGEDGLLVSVENIETELFQAMQTCLNDRTARMHWSQCAERKIRQRYTYHQVAGQFRAVLDAYREFDERK